MKRLKLLIVLVIVLILIIIGTIVYIKQKEYKQILIEDATGDPGQDVSFNTTKLETVTDRIRFFTVKRCIQQYLDELNENNSKYFGRDENEQDVRIMTDEEINTIRYNLLSKKYIDNNKVTIENVNDYVETFNEKVIFNALQMKSINGEQIEKYVVFGNITSLDNEYIKDIFIIVNLDRSQQTFSIEPLISSTYTSIDDINIEYDDSQIQKNENNKYIIKEMTNEETAKEYFILYKRMLQAKPDVIYNCLEEDYKKKRFENIDDFKSYVEKNKEEISKLQIQKYMVNYDENYTEFVCMDQYQNIYVFDEITPMNLEIKMDNYTIISDEFKEKYDQAKDEEKVVLNIDKWIQMINSRDYKSAYEVLNETFRNNNWGSEEEFESYMKEKFPLHYKVEYGNGSENNGIYTQEITLSDVTGEKYTKTSKDIIMQLKDNYEFEMSFNVD